MPATRILEYVAGIIERFLHALTPGVDFVGIGASVWKKWRFSEMKRRKDHQYAHEPNTENLVVGMHAYK